MLFFLKTYRKDGVECKACSFQGDPPEPLHRRWGSWVPRSPEEVRPLHDLRTDCMATLCWVLDGAFSREFLTYYLFTYCCGLSSSIREAGKTWKFSRNMLQTVWIFKNGIYPDKSFLFGEKCIPIKTGLFLLILDFLKNRKQITLLLLCFSMTLGLFFKIYHNIMGTGSKDKIGRSSLLSKVSGSYIDILT